MGAREHDHPDELRDDFLAVGRVLPRETRADQLPEPEAVNGEVLDIVEDVGPTS
jgi:hypothetical protein